MNKAQISPFIVLGVVILIIFTIIIIQKEEITREKINDDTVDSMLKVARTNITLPKDCSDGTKHEKCSDTQPYQCKNGILKENCIKCGCPINLECKENGTCLPVTLSENFKILFVPVNYPPDNEEFKTRATEYMNFVNNELNLNNNNYLMVEERFTPSDFECPQASKIGEFADQWHQKRFGESLPGVEYNGKIPIYKYRVIGIDRFQQNTDTCACGYTYTSYNPYVYVGGADCSRPPSVVLHELGHTFGLCDVYDTYEWTRQNRDGLENFNIGCGNAKPNAQNSNCGEDCNCGECADYQTQRCVFAPECNTCAARGLTSNWCFSACCDGTFADTFEDNYYSVMGTGDVPPERRFPSQSKDFIDRFLCDNFNECGGT